MDGTQRGAHSFCPPAPALAPPPPSPPPPYLVQAVAPRQQRRPQLALSGLVLLVNARQRVLREGGRAGGGGKVQTPSPAWSFLVLKSNRVLAKKHRQGLAPGGRLA